MGRRLRGAGRSPAGQARYEEQDGSDVQLVPEVAEVQERHLHQPTLVRVVEELREDRYGGLAAVTLILPELKCSLPLESEATGAGTDSQRCGAWAGGATEHSRCRASAPPNMQMSVPNMQMSVGEALPTGSLQLQEGETLE